MRYKLIFLSIILLAAALRFFNLPNNPPSLNWDEASLGYNAWTLLHYGTDEFGNAWPFSIRSFNDYKPPLYSYLTMLPVALFGLNEFSTRFISALLGTFTTVIVFFLTKEGVTVTKREKKAHNSLLTQYLPVIAALLFAISPWSLQFSRGAFEGNIAVFFTSLGMLFLFKWLNNTNSAMKQFSNIATATISFTLALYSYHAARLVIPLIGLCILLHYYKYFLKQWKQVSLIVAISAILLVPLLVITFRGSSGARVGAVSIFNPKYIEKYIQQREMQEKIAGNSLLSLVYDNRIQYIRLIIEGYLDHYDMSHMFINGDVVDRHHAPNMGLLYLIELPFIIVGLYSLAVKKFKGKFLFWSWWLIAPLPAALASGTPHAIRSILWLPLPQIATAVGIMAALTVINSKLQTQNSQKITNHKVSNLFRISNFGFLILLFGLFLANFIYYQIQYHIHQPVENARDWQFAYRQMIQYVRPLYPQFDDVIVTTGYDQPYIFFLFYEQYPLELGVNPGDFNHHYKNITFEAVDIFKLRDQYKADPTRSMLIIGAGDEIPPGEPIELNNIKFPNGEVAFRIVKFVDGK